MIIICPQCTTKYKVDEARISGDILKLRCSKCGQIFLLKKKAVPGPAKEELPVIAAGRKILIAHPSSSMREMMGELLREAGFFPLFAKNGVEAISIMEDTHPDVVIVDVALPDIFGFEFPELIRKDKRLESIKVILVASIYDKTRYKRIPQSLYGADDFIEKHHIRDSLAAKINRLLSKQEEVKIAPESTEAVQVGVGVNESPTVEIKTEDARKLNEEELLQTPEYLQDIEKAKRLARIIISDIALYNQEILEQGIRQDTVEEVLEKDLEEGKRLFKKRISEHIRQQGDFLMESLHELIQKKKKELGLVQ
jgi:predicted Zn finger-like uncharacterized protein